jgi:hypothetical protein
MPILFFRAEICFRSTAWTRRPSQRFDYCSNYFAVAAKTRLRKLIKQHTNFVIPEICVRHAALVIRARPFAKSGEIHFGIWRVRLFGMRITGG